MGKRRDVNNITTQVCIIDSSSQTTKNVKYLVESILSEPQVIVHNSPATVDMVTLKNCSLVIVSEIMADMSGTEFIGKLYDTFYMDEMHLFPNVIFMTHLAKMEIVRRLEFEDILFKIHSFRILQKPLAPEELKKAITELCPIMCNSINSTIEVPKTLTGLEALGVTMKTVLGMKTLPITCQL